MQDIPRQRNQSDRAKNTILLRGICQKRLSCSVDCHGFITYTRMTIATYKITRINGLYTMAVKKNCSLLVQIAALDSIII